MYVEHLYGKHRSQLSLQELEEGIGLTIDALISDAPLLEQQVLDDQSRELGNELFRRYGWLIDSRCEVVRLRLATRQQVRVAETVARAIPECSVVQGTAGRELLVGSNTSSGSRSPTSERPTCAAFMFLETITADMDRGSDFRRWKAAKELLLRLERQVRHQNQVDEDNRAIDDHFHAQQRRAFFGQFKKKRTR